MRRTRGRSDVDEPVSRVEPVRRDRWLGNTRWRANGWPVLPLRLFLAAVFCFAGYAKFSYPGFFDPNSRNGFKASVDAARTGHTPISSALGPLSDHASLFGHVTAVAEIAIGLGLLVGLLTRLAALGGMVLTALIVLSINWFGVKEYTGSSGWFTSVELALAAALSLFLLGGPGPLALDNLFIRARERQRARDDAEPSFRESEIEDSRRRLQGEPVPVPVPADSAAATTELPAGSRREGEHPTTQLPAVDRENRDRLDDRDRADRDRADRDRADRDRADRDNRVADDRPADARDRVADDRATDTATTELPADRPSGGNPGYADRAGQLHDEEYRDDPEPEPNSLWTQGRRVSPEQAGPERRADQPPATGPRRDG